MEKWDGRDAYLESSCPDYEGSKEILLKVENVTSEDINGSLSGSSSEYPEETLQKMKNIAGESTAPASEQPEGILQLIDKLDTIVDQLLLRYAICDCSLCFHMPTSLPRSVCGIAQSVI